jgi:hypothetical protein
MNLKINSITPKPVASLPRGVSLNGYMTSEEGALLRYPLSNKALYNSSS